MCFRVHQGNIELIGTEFETRAAPVAEGQQLSNNYNVTNDTSYLFHQHLLGLPIDTTVGPGTNVFADRGCCSFRDLGKDVNNTSSSTRQATRIEFGTVIFLAHSGVPGK